MSNSLIEHDSEVVRTHGTVAGMDEAGRGALAGPVVVGCVHIPGDALHEAFLEGVNDSKQLNFSSRERLFRRLAFHPLVRHGIGKASSKEIDRLGINKATTRAAQRAYRNMGVGVDLLLVDATLVPRLSLPVSELKKGDSRSLHIAAASIVAKVYRDRLMQAWSSSYPDYGWASNFGYGTAQHRKAIERAGITTLHRRSYKLK